MVLPNASWLRQLLQRAVHGGRIGQSEHALAVGPSHLHVLRQDAGEEVFGSVHHGTMSELERELTLVADVGLLTSRRDAVDSDHHLVRVDDAERAGAESACRALLAILGENLGSEPIQNGRELIRLHFQHGGVHDVRLNPRDLHDRHCRPGRKLPGMLAAQNEQGHGQNQREMAHVGPLYYAVKKRCLTSLQR